MSKRTTTDPLARLFLDRYHLHLLAIPREDSAVGDLYVEENGQVFAPGNVVRLLRPKFKMPPVRRGEHMADLDGTVSNSVAAEVGLGLLGSFFIALGAGALLEKVRAAFQSKKVRTLRFRFRNATRDAVDSLYLQEKLVGHRLSAHHPLFDKGRRYYLVSGVARSSSISVTPQTIGSAAAEAKLGVAQLADAEASVKVEASESGELTFSGDRPLAFGVELFELVYNEQRRQLKLKTPEGAIKLRTARETQEPLVEPVFIGGDHADIFLKVMPGGPK